MAKVANPILPGFNPDPSILRVGSDYYIATSTFEWFPGVQIHHSTDLANWELLTRPLTRKSQLDMRGDPDSCGVWAPCLTHDDEKFWLVYTDVKRKDGSFKDAHNYIVTADEITGPWSDPAYVNSSGFDPSLFHDDDGRKWFVNMLWDHRARPLKFAGIALQEWDPVAQKLVGERKNIFTGTDLKLVEGPHLYKRDGWYYLLTAEGGHRLQPRRHLRPLAQHRRAVRTASAKAHPDGQRPITSIACSARSHGDLVDTPDGRSYLVHLMGRPTTQKRRCVLGRETGIQEIEWRDDGWPSGQDRGGAEPRGRSAGGARRSQVLGEKVLFLRPARPADRFPVAAQPPEPERIFSLTDRAGVLRLHGRESIASWFEQALVARRQQHFNSHRRNSARFLPDRRTPDGGPASSITGATISTTWRSPPIPTASANCC